jgi:N-dimethylarginine dimethylaminohydrolase
MTDLYLMSPPGKDWQLRGRANFRSREAEPVDAMKARREWLGLAEAIEETGAVVVVAPPVSGLTGMPYAAECGQVVRDGERTRFLLPRMLAEHRKGEAEHWAALAQRLGWDVVDIGGGTWEAQGDVARFDGVTLLFFGGRTDREGHARARAFFRGEVLDVEVREPAFHGNMALLPLAAADRILVCPDALVGDSLARLEARFGRERILHVTEAEIRSYATNGLPIGRTLLAPSLVPERVRDLVSGLGMTVKLLAMDELCGKAGGASRCLVCHVPDMPDAFIATIPEENRLARFAAEIRREGA